MRRKYADVYALCGSKNGIDLMLGEVTPIDYMLSICIVGLYINWSRDF